MKQGVSVIHCSVDRCESCCNRKESRCKKLHALFEEAHRPIVLTETDRGLLHLWFPDHPLLNDPPWYSEGWESVFIGTNNALFRELDDLIDVYCVGPYLCFFMKQYNEHQIRFMYIPIVRTSLELSLLSNLASEFKNIANPLPGVREQLTTQQTRIMNEISGHIQKYIPEINENTRIRLSQIAAHSTNTLGPLFPILLDELTEEVYFDGPDTAVYFDHQKYGRCITSITYNVDEVPRIITFIRAESNLHLDRGNPSLKMELNLLGIVLRLSVSIPPLSTEGLYLEIRRARKEPFSIKSLIENETITPQAAAILILAIVSRLNITITGGPGTGKTTLLNALDMITPHWWRKIYIEDAIESRTLTNQHQVRLQVNPVDEHHKTLNKSEEIVKCLHRSPDYLILGEIQTIEHSQSLFQAIAAGLRSIQTCHSDSASSLISRWNLGHGIEKSNLGLMDLIVTLERPKPGESLRYVKEIVEIRKVMKNGLLEFLGTNILYDVMNPNVIHWTQDGIFQNLARSLDIKDHQSVIDTLIETVRNCKNDMDFEKLGERMWSFGHPMRFTGFQSR
ncbi:MAG: ATPase, T2SS/T4P/T4SS family [Candidatus Odinarchaeota archaeon]